MTALGAVEWRYGLRQSMVVQYLVTEGLIDDLGALSELSHEITLGWKRELHPRTVLEIGMIENVYEFDNTPDFGFQFSIARRF